MHPKTSLWGWQWGWGVRVPDPAVLAGGLEVRGRLAALNLAVFGGVHPQTWLGGVLHPQTSPFGVLCAPKPACGAGSGVGDKCL